MLAAKTALTVRYDALGEDTSAEMGAENRLKVETRMRVLEERGVSSAEGWMRLTASLWYNFWCTTFWVISLHSVVWCSVTSIVWYLPTLPGAVEFGSWLHPFVCMSVFLVYMPVSIYVILKNLDSGQHERHHIFTACQPSGLLAKIGWLLHCFFTLQKTQMYFLLFPHALRFPSWFPQIQIQVWSLLCS